MSLIHEIDYACWIFGIPSTVFAVGGHLSALEMNVEDTASILMSCSNGDVAIPVHIHLDFVRRPRTRTLKIVGDQGSIFWDYYANSLRIFDTSMNSWKTISLEGFERNQMFVDEMQHFVRSIQGKEAPKIQLMDGIRSLAVAIGIKNSISTGEVVEIKPRV